MVRTSVWDDRTCCQDRQVRTVTFTNYKRNQGKGKVNISFQISKNRIFLQIYEEGDERTSCDRYPSIFFIIIRFRIPIILFFIFFINLSINRSLFYFFLSSVSCTHGSFAAKYFLFLQLFLFSFPFPPFFLSFFLPSSLTFFLPSSTSLLPFYSTYSFPSHLPYVSPLLPFCPSSFSSSFTCSPFQSSHLRWLLWVSDHSTCSGRDRGL